MDPIGTEFQVIRQVGKNETKPYEFKTYSSVGQFDHHPAVWRWLRFTSAIKGHGASHVRLTA